MSEDPKKPATAAATAAAEGPLAPQEVSVLKGLARLFGFEAKAEEPKAAALAVAEAPAAKTEAVAAKTEEPKTAVTAAAAPTQEAVDAMVLQAFKNIGVALQPRTPAASKAVWPTTQREALQWASGTADQKRALDQAVTDGFQYQRVPKY